MHHLPLVFFTVFVQASAGLMLCFGLNRLAAPATINNAGAREYFEPQMLMWGLFIIGVGASFIHLGKPVNVMNIFGGLSHRSPLSMEILCALIFGALCLVYTVMCWKGSNHKARAVTLSLAVLAGLTLSYAIVNVYTIATVPLWNSIWTLIQFFMSMIALGITALLFIGSMKPASAAMSWKKWNSAAFIALLCLLVSSLLYFGWCAGMLAQSGVDMPDAPFRVARIIFQCVAIITLMLAFKREPASAAKFYAAIFLCILASELAGRVFFYDLQQFSGMMLYAS